MVQLLALDLDETLLDDEGQISAQNLRALSEAEDAGVRIVLATGRPLESTQDFAARLGLFERPGFLVSDNGATITSTLPQAILVQHQLDSGLVGQLFEAFDLLDLPVQVYRDRCIWVTRDNPWTRLDSKVSGFSVEVDSALANKINFQPPKMVVPADPEVLPAAYGVIQKAFGHRVRLVVSKGSFLEILPLQADKGTALGYVASTCGVLPANVMAIGDETNDLTMIEMAGWGVAMANACRSVQRAARIITHFDNNHDGVAEIIDRYVLCKKG